MSDFAEKFRSPVVSAPPSQKATTQAAVADRPAPVPLAQRIEQEIRAGRVELPVLPQVAIEVQQLMDREADITSLVKVIEREPSVAAALIKYANAAVYAGLRDVTDLHQALLRLGLDSVRQAVLSISAKGAFETNDPNQRRLYQTIWLHSLTTAIAARRLAALVSVAPETAFLAGLMHDIGRIVVLRGISALRKRDPQSFLVPAHTVREFTDALHCPIGDVLCHEWNIPAELRDAVARHHEPGLSEPKDTLAAVVQVADLMAAKVGASLHPDPELTLIGRPSLQLLGLDDVRIATLLIDLEDEREQLATIF
jgi:putative nucleotidyltransferase with HDIG domain